MFGGGSTHLYLLILQINVTLNVVSVRSPAVPPAVIKVDLLTFVVDRVQL